ncbi:hypothetical protein C4J81_11630 [Deltaproteobacteria bacterium Smac51]|nr:hypothetical protein C4J81_11630 [Deltaproteobacteria bacterium Smac51]
MLEVSGTVVGNETMQRDGMPYVSLSGSGDHKVFCYFDQKRGLLEIDSQVTIRGKCDGVLYGRVSLDHSVVVE